ncbi:MAG: hypothetical protein AAFM92_10370 [Pseudomonadota bacterium]
MPDDPCCGRPLSRKETTRHEAGLDELDFDVLTISRFYWQQFAMPMSQSWLYALREAEAAFPGREAATIAFAILAAVQANRCSRVSTFHFNNPGCGACRNVISEHERQFMSVFRAVRAGRVGAARTHAMLLCEGNDTTDFIEEMQALVALLDAVQAMPLTVTVGLPHAPV